MGDVDFYLRLLFLSLINQGETRRTSTAEEILTAFHWRLIAHILGVFDEFELEVRIIPLALAGVDLAEVALDHGRLLVRELLLQFKAETFPDRDLRLRQVVGSIHRIADVFHAILYVSCHLVNTWLPAVAQVVLRLLQGFGD